MTDVALDNIEPPPQQSAVAVTDTSGRAASNTASVVGEVSSKSERHEVTVKDTPAWWNLTACVAWILARDPSAVVALSKPLPAVDKGAILLAVRAEMAVLSAVDRPPIFLRYRLKTIRNARGELLDALAKEKLVAFGDRRTGNGLEPIPAVEWSRVRPPFEDGRDRAGPYHDVVLARAEVLRHWPSPSAAVEDEPNHLEAGSRAGACAATEPAEITEPAAADVQQETELTIAIGRSGSLSAEITEWYRDAWVPECRNAGLIPTRDDDLKAARRRLGSTLRGQRGLVRRARREHGPEEWRKTGPKGLDRKNNDNHELVNSVIERACQFRQPE